MENGVARLPAPDDALAYAGNIRNPENHPFSTTSGKLEVYSTMIADNHDSCGLGIISPIPTWVPHAEDNADYPLRYCCSQSRAQTHSVHDCQPRLARVDPDDVWINTDYANTRSIENGQKVRVFNQHGATFLPARVTDDIAPGVVSIKEGAWFTPDTDSVDTEGVDTEGCANAMTTELSAPSGATTYNTNFVALQPA